MNTSPPSSLPLKQRVWFLFLKLSSVRLTISCFVLALILIFWGTIAQVHLGTFRAQQVFFNSFFVMQDFNGFKFPIFPGGMTLGLLWLINLIAAFVVRFRLRENKIGLFISHAGLILLLAGQCFTQLLAVESMLPIEIGESRNYSESAREMEMVLIDKSDPNFDEVTSIPESILKSHSEISVPKLPFKLLVRKFYENAHLSMAASNTSLRATRGIGTRVQAQEAPPVSTDDEQNATTALIEVKENETSHGVWLVSAGLGAPQSFNVQGRDFEIAMRPKRYYFPFTITLKEFHHDIYPGTDIPKNFSSLVQLVNPENKEERNVLIYMNHPLRYDGKTFYQASFGKNDSLSIFQVVENPFAPSPYLGCAMVLLGLGFHFLMHLTRFIKKSL